MVVVKPGPTDARSVGCLRVTEVSYMKLKLQLAHFVRLTKAPADKAANAPAGISRNPHTVDVGMIHAIILPMRTAMAPIHGPRRIPARGYNGTENSMVPVRIPKEMGIPGSLVIMAIKAANTAIKAVSLSRF